MSDHQKGWIGVDLDGTLAEYHGWNGPTHIGAPVPLMVERVKAWLAAGIEVRVFTARIAHDSTLARQEDAAVAHLAIIQWCRDHIGQALDVTGKVGVTQETMDALASFVNAHAHLDQFGDAKIIRALIARCVVVDGGAQG